METIKAIRNGERREFDERLWNNMPDGKYGWVPAAEIPDVVKQIQGEVLNTESDPSAGVQLNSDLPPVKTDEQIPAAEIPDVVPEILKADETINKSKKGK